jgi:hypothetical protein
VDIADTWRRMRAGSAEAPSAGAHQETAGPGITIDITQQCQIALPQPNVTPNEVTVTVTSHRPGVTAQVTIGANLNTADGSYQGPTTTVGHGQFTATSTQVRAGFVVLPSGWPVLGVGAEAVWGDGAPQSITLNYWQLACDPWVWWRWPIQVLYVLARLLSARASPIAPRGREDQA